MQNNRESGFYNPRVFLAFVFCFGAALLALVGFAAPTEPPLQSPQTANSAGNFLPIATTSAFNGVSPALRDLPVVTPIYAAPIIINPVRPIHPPIQPPLLPVYDSVQQASAPVLAMPAPLQTFEGMNQADGCGNCIPPDPTGVVGPNHFAEMVNSSFAIYSKTGTKLVGPTHINALWQNLPGPCKDDNDGDPIVVYDHLADRWVLSQFAVNGGSGPFDECIAVSTSSDPTGTYYVYDFHLSNTIFNDYPKLGVWPDGYYMTMNEFDSTTGNTFIGAGAYAFERDKMLIGQSAQMLFFDESKVNGSFGGMLPSYLDGPPPPPGTPNFFAEVDSIVNSPGLGADAMRIWKFHVDWSNPASSTFGLAGQPDFVLPVASWNPSQCVESQGTCVPQMGSSTQLDVVGDRIMFRLAYRNFGDHDSLLINHSVLADARVGVRWYEVRGLSTSTPTSTPSIYQQGTFAPTDTFYRWMGSIAMDVSGNIAVGYSISSAASFPSINYAGRLAGDPLGVLTQGETQMFAGLGPENVQFFIPPVGRWGDYTTLSVDPTDGCTFWYVNEYFPDQTIPDPSAPWHTRIGSFKFSQCVASAPSPTPTATATSTATATATATATIGSSSTPTATATATATPAGTPDPACIAPGVTVTTDPAGDEVASQAGASPEQDLDVQSLQMSEPFTTASDKSVTFTLKTASLAAPLPPNATWFVRFSALDTTNTSRNLYVEMDTNGTNPTVPEFHIGRTDVTGGQSGDTSQSTLDGDITGSFTADGTIKIKLLTEVDMPMTATGAPNFTVRLVAGSVLSSVKISSAQLIGAAGTGLNAFTDQDTNNSGVETYTLKGNAACAFGAGTPTPTPTSTPSSSPACSLPGVTVVSDTGTNDAADGQSNHDIISASVAYPFTSASDPDKLYFTIKVGSLSTLTPNSFYFVSFTFDGNPECGSNGTGSDCTTSNGNAYGVRMVVDAEGNATFESYKAGASGGTPPRYDGRFVEGSPIPAEPGSGYSTDGTITIIVKRSDLGVAIGHTLTNWDGAVAETAGGVATALLDGMPATTGNPPSTISRGGLPFTVASNQSCNGGVGPTPTPTPTATPTVAPSPITFSPNYTTRAPYIGQDVEPSVRCDKFGNCYVAAIRGVPGGTDLWYFDLRPTVNGLPNPNYDPYMRNPQYRGQPDKIGAVPCTPPAPCDGTVGSDGGGDVDIAVGFNSEATEDPNAPPTLAYSSLVVGNISTQTSADRGATFTANPAGNVTGGVPGDDRQWLEFFGPSTVYLFYRTLEPAISQVQQSIDGGLTYGPAATAGAVGQAGGISVDQNDGTVYIAGSTGSISVGVPPAPGLAPVTYTTHVVTGGSVAHLFFLVKVGPDGTVYACYSDDHNVYVKFSTNKGLSWSDPIQVSQGPESKTAVFPAITTGRVPGTIGVAWYGSTKDSTGDDSADWYVFYSLVTNVTGTPVLHQARASDHVIHAANISENGLVVGGQSPNRNLADYFQLAFDPTGAAVIAYADDHNDLSGHTYVTRQISGLGATGAQVPAPVEGSNLPPPANEPLPKAADVGGIPGSQVTDFKDDVRLGGNPELGGTAVVPVDDPLDILSIIYSAEPTSATDSSPMLVATMKVSDMTTIPVSSNWRMTFAANAPNSVLSPTGEYSFGVSDRADDFFYQATTDPSGAQTFVYGTAKRNFDGSITYTNVGSADCGFFDQTTKTITLKVSLSKLNAALPVGHPQIVPGSVLVGLRGSTFTTAGSGTSGNNKADTARGGTQYVVTVGATPTECGPSSGASPTPTPTATATASPTPTSTATATATVAPTATATATATVAPTATATATATVAPTATATATATVAPTATATATATVAPTATATATATVAPTATATATATVAPTATATATATVAPTATATVAPTATATATATVAPTATATVAPTATATATIAPTATATATPIATATATATATPTASPTATPAQLLNISTRANVLTGDNILIGGFIITGNNPKKVLIMAKGPSLNVNGTPVPGRMLDPTLELHAGNGSLMTSNDNWKDSPERAQIEATGLAPSDDRESAILRTLDPGVYTGVLIGKNNSTGIASVEIYDVDANDSILGNISSRGLVDTGDNVMIGGFIAGNQNGNTKVLVRGIGPSLQGKVPNPLSDPILELHDSNGNTLETNDNWKDSPNRAQIEATGIPPSNDLESAIIRMVSPAGYTAILRGKTGNGIAVVEIYNIQ